MVVLSCCLDPHHRHHIPDDVCTTLPDAMQRWNNRETLGVAIIVCAVFLQFFVVDHWSGGSGVLSVVTFGVLLSKEKDKVRRLHAWRVACNKQLSASPNQYLSVHPPANFFNMECMLAWQIMTLGEQHFNEVVWKTVQSAPACISSPYACLMSPAIAHR